jgi:hypothetical protein
MLTRDIELQDAILDLLDNCVDGILRSTASKSRLKRPYTGYRANIVMSGNKFIIEDNCGGIPIETAKKYAFAMGRPEGAKDAGASSTVGLYGIGMKRAIFKLGRSALVASRHDTGFVVEFSPTWMNTDKWDDLPMFRLPPRDFREKGTRVTVQQLHDDVKLAFSDSTWIDTFRKVVARQYAIIISKGFEVRIGNDKEIKDGIEPIKAEEFQLLRTSPSTSTERRIMPFIYTGTIRGVDVEVFAGLYRKLLSEDEIGEEEETRGRTDDAGWTIACNDRVVIWKDKTRLTGWGEATVPNYHGQFIAITGIVLMHSDDPKLLPLTTTKRGIDAASAVYSEVKDLMRDATKTLTAFTNKWKNFPRDLEKIYQSSEYLSIDDLRKLPQSLSMTKSRKHDGIKKFEPKYPEPAQEKTNIRVSFSPLRADVVFLAERYFDDPKAKPGEVGEAAFNVALKIERKAAK